ncbi:MAG: hypothetical protein INR73_00215 [Williamsia sp.]|nr:hypothetical protein [Williamsia sp.]
MAFKYDLQRIFVLNTLKNYKLTLLYGLFYLVALQILNLSVDIDYVISRSVCSTALVEYDDIDSFSEYILEKIAGDSNYTSEDDIDDDESSRNKSIEKNNINPLYAEQFTRPQLSYDAIHGSPWATGLDQANKICKGYFTMIFSPPKV